MPYIIISLLFSKCTAPPDFYNVNTVSPTGPINNTGYCPVILSNKTINIIIYFFI